VPGPKAWELNPHNSLVCCSYGCAVVGIIECMHAVVTNPSLALLCGLSVAPPISSSSRRRYVLLDRLRDIDSYYGTLRCVAFCMQLMWSCLLLAWLPPCWM
jgi:hypothetical protein